MVGEHGVVIIHDAAARGDIHKALRAAVADRVVVAAVMEGQPGDAQALQIVAHHGRHAEIPERAREHDRVRGLELVGQREKRQAERARGGKCIALGNVLCVVGGQMQRGQREHLNVRVRDLADQPLRQPQCARLRPADAAVDE